MRQARVLVALTVVTGATVPGVAGAAGSPPESILGARCSDVDFLRIYRQLNLLDSPQPVLGDSRGEETAGFGVEDYGGIDVDVVEFDPFPQFGSMIWSNGSTIVVTYVDLGLGANNYGGVSRSVDGGSTFQRRHSPLPGHGSTLAGPLVVWNDALQSWLAGFLVGGCGAQGIGLWTSPDALVWTAAACAHSGNLDDRASMWVDNNPGSAYFGRMYISWNDFNLGGPLFVIHSDDGANWTAPAQVTPNFIRNVQLTGSPTDGTVFIAGMDEHGGFANQLRTNWMYISSDGGDTWLAYRMGPDFVGPGVQGCDSGQYFWRVNPSWRQMGWGQPAVGPNGIVHYAYSGHGRTPSDLADIYYVRSVDNGQTWSVPIVLNTDGTTAEQWMPSVSVTAGGDVFVGWHDRRNTTDGQNFAYWGIQSTDNGATWLPDMAVSDVLSPQGANFCAASGDVNYHSAFGNTHLITWTDYRVSFQQDVFFDQVQAP